MGDESDALNDIWDSHEWSQTGKPEGITQAGESSGLPPRNRMPKYPSREVITPQDAYTHAKDAKTGAVVHCPTYTKTFTKKSYQQAFCSNKGTANCKDRFWNHTIYSRIVRGKAWQFLK